MEEEFESDERTAAGRTTQSADASSGETSNPARESVYLLVFEGDSCSVFQLPHSGTAVIGRQEGCDLRLEDKQVSRMHCQISTEGGRAALGDLGSQNGTWVNGERIAGARSLVSGDVISVSGTTLVFHTRARSEERREILEFDAFCRRAAQDVERAERLRHPLAIATIALGSDGADWPRLQDVLRSVTRRIDQIGRGPGEQIMIAMPGADHEAAHAALSRLLPALQQDDVRLRIRAGIAISPADGCDLDTLIANARAACSAARVGEICRAVEAGQMLHIGQHQIVVIEAAMKRLYQLIERLAKAELPVIVYGETGSGKELAASALHFWSNRKDRPFIALNCAAMPETLAESELFGHVRGSFSGATENKTGLLESASGGTVFFDEIGELPLAIQAKLLRALETKRIVRIGDVQERAVDIRIVGATNRDLSEEVKAGRFRQDLFFRLSGGTLWIPPLRDRPQELAVMVKAFVEDACTRVGREPMRISDEALRCLRAHSWPGNVRELKNVVEYVVAAHADSVLEPRHLADRIQAAADHVDSGAPTRGPMVPQGRVFRPIDEEIRELEIARMREALIEVGGNQKKAAELIGMPLRTFVTKLKLYDLRSQLRVTYSDDRREK